MQEIWEDIEGFEGLYQVSNLGNVKNIRRNRILKPGVCKSGYYTVSLYKNKTAKTYKVSRLVISHFVPNVDCKPYCNHIDGNKLNDRLDNLEWCTQKENVHHANSTGLRKAWKGETSPNSKLKARDILTIRKMLNEGIYQKDIAKKFGVYQTCISQIKLGKLWKDVA